MDRILIEALFLGDIGMCEPKGKFLRKVAKYDGRPIVVCLRVPVIRIVCRVLVHLAGHSVLKVLVHLTGHDVSSCHHGLVSGMLCHT